MGQTLLPDGTNSGFQVEANKVADVAKEVERAEQLSLPWEPDLEKWEDRVEGDIRKDTKTPDIEFMRAACV